ncbi:MAG: type II toxin-antitoxin system RelE/ParE family toxin [Planctomycetes bacterium]|nr:type II toxin-antitoxin system RelE/ParE family toxin [Planctomycetota bacterium]
MASRRTRDEGRARRVRIRAEAREEILAALTWYAERDARVARAFAHALSSCVRGLRRFPHRYPELRTPSRRAWVRRFPYKLLYFVTDEAIVITALRHTSRDDAT